MSPHVTLLLSRQSQGVAGQLLSRRRIYDQIILTYAKRTDFTHVFGGNDVLISFPLYTGLHIDHLMDHLIGVKVLCRQYLQMWMLLYIPVNRFFPGSGMDAYVVHIGKPLLQLYFKIIHILE